MTWKTRSVQNASLEEFKALKSPEIMHNEIVT